MSSITEALREARKAAGLKQCDVAQSLGLSPQFLADVERGRRELGPQHYAALPPSVRGPVIAAAIETHRSAISWLRALGKA